MDSGKAKVKLNNWVRLHDHNISQKVKVIIEHFKKNIMGLLGGQAMAMVSLAHVKKRCAISLLLISMWQSIITRVYEQWWRFLVKLSFTILIR